MAEGNIPSSAQTIDSKRLRGQDYSDAETQRAMAHKFTQLAIANAATRHLRLLRGNPVAARNLQFKTMALSSSSPAYEEWP